MDDETSTRHIFFFMLLLIPFLVIDLNVIKALIIILPKISPLKIKLLYLKGLDRPINYQIYSSNNIY